MKQITIVHLYPREMNIYGDTGNRLILQRRLEWAGIKAKIALVGIGDKLPTDTDIVLGGGGQDAGQAGIVNDLKRKSSIIHSMVDNGVPMLMICGLYQLFGHYFKTGSGVKLEGIGVFNATTLASSKRLIGNIIIDTEFGEIIGYENHSGLTLLDSNQKPFGRSILGQGNNGDDLTEGAMKENAIGTYAHGPIFSKNPQLADHLLRLACDNRGVSYVPPIQHDNFIDLARDQAKTRPR